MPSLRQSEVVRVAAGDACRARRRAHGGCRRRAVSHRRSAVPLHRDRRGRGRDRRRGGQRDRPPRRVGFPRRAQPAVRPDRFRDGGRYAAVALHRGRPRRAAAAAVRGRAAERPAPVHLHRAARVAPGRSGPWPGGRGPAFIRGDHADARLRAEQPPAVHLARSGAGGRPVCRRAGRRARCLEPAAGALAGRHAVAAHRRPARFPARLESAASSSRGRRSTSWS